MENAGHFKPGNDFATGRPTGARNKTSYQLRDRLKARGDKDPAEFLSEIVSNEKEPKELRIAASGQLMPYYHSKLGATPVLPPPQYIQEAVSLPRPTSIREAYDNILKLSEMKAQGQLDFVTADSLIADQRVVLNAMVDEAKLLAAQGDPTIPQKIIIEGGLPTLPGCESLIMPEINGHSLELSAIPTIPAQTQGSPPAHPPEENKPE
jgi:hypothetical protein